MKRPHRYLPIVLMAVLALVLVLGVACAKATPTPTPKPTPTATKAAGVTPGATPTAAPTPTKAVGVPDPKSPKGRLIFVDLTQTLANAPGSDPSLSAMESRNFGVGEGLFDTTWQNYENLSLASSYQLAPDLSTVTIKIKQGVKFHKGWGELKASDMCWVIDYTNPGVNPTSIATSASTLTALFGTNKCQVIDDYTIKLTFSNFDVRWASFLLNNEGQVTTVATPKAAFDKDPNYLKSNVVSTGPFQVTKAQSNLELELAKFPDYWGTQKAQVDTIRVLAVDEEATRVAQLQTGEADLAYVDPKDLARVKKLGFSPFDAGQGLQEGVFFAGNLWEKTNALTGQPLADLTKNSGVYARFIPWQGCPWDFCPTPDTPNPAGMDNMERARLVRTAMAISVDRQAIIDSVLGGVGTPVYVDWFSTKSPQWNDKWKYPYDPAQAEKILDQAGYPRVGGANGTRFDMPLFVGPELGGGAGPGGEIGDAIAGFWQKIGINVQVLKYAYAVFRPGLVGRNTVVPVLTSCDEGQETWPWDWPKGLVMTSLTRGGFSCGIESPDILNWYKQSSAEPDVNKRIAINNQVADYLYKWALNPGYVSVPVVRFGNPKSIKSWQMQPALAGSGLNHPENLVPTR